MSELHPHEVYERVGGLAAFETLVEAFYARVSHDELLRPHYPEDLEPGKRHLALFLAQYFGGGDVYSSERGHPRLRMRHATFTITPEVAARWEQLMSEAIRELRLSSDVERVLLRYVSQATPMMVNAFPEQGEQLPQSHGG